MPLPIPSRLRVRLLSHDLELARTLQVSLIDEDVDVLAHATAPEPDVVLVDAGPPPPSRFDLERLASETSSARVVVLARTIDAETRDLGHALGAVGYMKNGAGLHDVAALVVELASLAG